MKYLFLKNLNRTSKALIIATGFYIFLLIIALSKYNYNFSAFINLGDDKDSYTYEYLSDDYIDKGTVVFNDIVGYDGSQYFFMAHDPLLTKKGFMDNFRKRHFFRYKKRILYPFTAYILSFGQQELIPFVLVFINFLAIILGAYGLSKILKIYNVKSEVALLYALGAGISLSFFYDLTEPFGYALIIASLYFYEKKNILICTIFLILSFLTREAAVIVIWALMINELIKKEYKNCLILASSAIPVLIFQLFISSRFETLNLVDTNKILSESFSNELYSALFSGAVGIPFKGMFNALIHTDFSGNTTSVLKKLPNILTLFFVIGCFFNSVRQLLSKYSLYTFILFFHLLFLVRGYEDLWSTFLNTARVNAYIFLFLPLSFSERKDKITSFLVLIAVILSFFAVVKIFADTLRPFHLY